MIYRQRHLSIVDALTAIAAAFMVMLAFWQDFDARVLVFIVIALALTEGFVMMRWRLSIACRRCGFDAGLYQRDQPAAAARVKEHMARRRDDPLALFSPPLRLHVLKKKPSPLTAERTDVRLSTRL